MPPLCVLSRVSTRKTHVAKQFAVCHFIFNLSCTLILEPHPVLNLQARPKNTTSVEVTWLYPNDAKTNYKYWVRVAGGNFSDHVDGNSIEISNLEPGTRYDISVTVVVAANKSQSIEEHTYTYTSKALHSSIQ